MVKKDNSTEVLLNLIKIGIVTMMGYIIIKIIISLT